ncbi:putative F-box domain-containing protein [Helianthus annuus]|uniref:F-box domain-containing protein n=2 Tax=Helianthus annuus TaxID=4232 RepID=A0A251RW41_HELAN|nr:F-box/FBD/LRR-repeat protein At1g13570 isoform X2 [Helianthus annuus]XP_035841930.1 F-box/FBD/LRR-repeat protein At1g13570 isoform X2 [Helianthus annuus]XP_035841931.1 F-box/FBD/LRR-repeat protein At1g13570 isoform X2 [Helianthus annuus]KAF5758370.1 putative F-box domain-containing protein [Helianthus annuus]KAJ0436724.1 putative F-box domain, leucine-rich repeat domain superfamily, F-box-like domain superfamily [Helianthus annuus]KAJ0440944.1 putative F-box domain-containing protein [Helia
MKTRSMYKAERMSLDRLPEPVLETILCCLPTEDAARTSILSREWRYKWTTIPNLRFTLRNRTLEPTSDNSSAKKYMNIYDVYRVLLLRQGPIHEFTIVMDDYWQRYNYFEFYQIILHLSRKHTIKKLTLDGHDDLEFIWYKLPESVFTLHHLTDLCLSTFEIDHPSIFKGFGSLQRLDLSYVKISTKTLLHLLSNCPSLKNLSLVSTHLNIWEPGDKCTMNELLKCLPVIEDLTMSGDVSEWLVLDSVPKELPTSLIHLKYLCLNQMCLVGRHGSAFLLCLIKCSPNLEHAHLEMEWGLDFSAVKDEYSDVWLEHLNELDVCFGSNELQTEFVKFILARSPKLKTVSILTVVDRKQDSKMLKTLLRAPRASPGVNIYTWK